MREIFGHVEKTTEVRAKDEERRYVEACCTVFLLPCLDA